MHSSSTISIYSLQYLLTTYILTIICMIYGLSDENCIGVGLKYYMQVFSLTLSRNVALYNSGLLYIIRLKLGFRFDLWLCVETCQISGLQVFVCISQVPLIVFPEQNLVFKQCTQHRQFSLVIDCLFEAFSSLLVLHFMYLDSRF